MFACRSLDDGKVDFLRASFMACNIQSVRSTLIDYGKLSQPRQSQSRGVT